MFFLSISTVIWCVFKTGCECCFGLFFVLSNVDEFIDGVTNDCFGCLRTNQVFYGFRTVDDSTGVSRVQTIRGCMVLITVKYREEMWAIQYVDLRLYQAYRESKSKINIGSSPENLQSLKICSRFSSVLPRRNVSVRMQY